MMLWVYIVLLLLASALLWKVLGVLLEHLSIFFAGIGGNIHTSMRLQDGEEKDAWLFALLIGITRQPIVVLGVATFFVEVLQFIYAPFWVLAVKSLIVGAFLFLLALRLLGIVTGSVMYGAPVRNVIKSLES